MIKKNGYIFTALLIAILLATCIFACAFWLFAEDQSVYADYNELLTNSNTIINFNQLLHNNAARESSTAGLNFTYVGNGVVHVYGDYSNNYGATYRFYSSPYSFDMLENHYYYIYVGNVDTINYKLMVSSGDYAVKSLTSRGNIYYSPNNRAMHIGVSFQPSNSYDFYASAYVIDLTQCFGSGNEPTLQQCNDLFISQFYPYDTGTPISLSGLNEYARGVNDTINNFNLNVVNFSAFTSAIIIDELSSSFPSTFINRYIDYSVLDVPFINARGVLGVPFSNIVNAGSIIKFNYIDPSMGGSGDYLWCGIYYNNSFVPIMLVQENDVNIDSEGYYSFTTPFDTQYLLFCNSSTRDYFTLSTSSYWIGDLQVVNSKFGDIQVLIDSAISGAIYERDEYYSYLYNSGGSGYETIYQQGYNAGLNANYEEALGHIYTFNEFIGALFDVPVHTLISLLDFNVFGFNMKNFVFSLITLSIVFAIIKVILVKAGDK